MKDEITKAIESSGRDIRINGKRGKAVIYPERYAENFSGGIVRNHNGIKDPHRSFIIAQSGLLDDAVIGDIVREGTNEYYVLWTDDIKTKFGCYTKACIRKCERGEV